MSHIETLSLAGQSELECVVWTTGRCLDQRDFERLRLIFTVNTTVVTRETAIGHDALVQQAHHKHP